MRAQPGKAEPAGWAEPPAGLTPVALGGVTLQVSLPGGRRQAAHSVKGVPSEGLLQERCGQLCTQAHGQAEAALGMPSSRAHQSGQPSPRPAPPGCRLCDGRGPPGVEGWSSNVKPRIQRGTCGINTSKEPIGQVMLLYG